MSGTYKFLNDTLHVGQPSKIELTFEDSSTVNSLPNILGILITGDVKKVDSASTTWTVDFSTYKLGELTFDSLQIPYVDSKGEDQVMYLHGKGPVVGTSVLDTNFKSSYFGYSDYPLAKGELATLIGAFLIIFLLIAFGIYKFVTRPKPVIPKAFYEDPEKSSKEKFDELMNMNLWNDEEGIREHYFILSEIIKFHFSVEQKTSFMENTTIEILAMLKDTFQYEEYKKIKSFFDETDIIKYTKMIPSEEEIKKTNSDALSLISIMISHEGEDGE